MEVEAPPKEERPLLLVDGSIPDGPLEALDQVAEVVRFADETELDRFIRRRGEKVVGLGAQLTTAVDDALLARLPALRIVADYAVGYDNVDLEAAARRGVVVTHTPDVLTDATADLTWALILAVARRLLEGTQSHVRESGAGGILASSSARSSPEARSRYSAWGGSAKRSRGGGTRSACGSSTGVAARARHSTGSSVHSNWS